MVWAYFKDLDFLKQPTRQWVHLLVVPLTVIQGASEPKLTLEAVIPVTINHLGKAEGE
jgi:hypothetical protein